MEEHLKQDGVCVCTAETPSEAGLGGGAPRAPRAHRGGLSGAPLPSGTCHAAAPAAVPTAALGARDTPPLNLRDGRLQLYNQNTRIVLAVDIFYSSQQILALNTARRGM